MIGIIICFRPITQSNIKCILIFIKASLPNTEKHARRRDRPARDISSQRGRLANVGDIANCLTDLL